jgi:hypothetical protein
VGTQNVLVCRDVVCARECSDEGQEREDEPGGDRPRRISEARPQEDVQQEIEVASNDQPRADPRLRQVARAMMDADREQDPRQGPDGEDRDERDDQSDRKARYAPRLSGGQGLSVSATDFLDRPSQRALPRWHRSRLPESRLPRVPRQPRQDRWKLLRRLPPSCRVGCHRPHARISQPFQWGRRD